MVDSNDPEPIRYYEWMLWKLRQERKEDNAKRIEGLWKLRQERKEDNNET